MSESRPPQSKTAPPSSATDPYATSPNPKNATRAGEVIGGYKLVKRLGAGGFGEVWQAEGEGGFSVALKMVRWDAHETGPQGADVELRSLDIIKGLHHPNLLHTFAAWHTGDTLYIAMELADQSLFDRYREVVTQGNRGLPRPELLEYLRDAARGIDYLNEPRHVFGGSEPRGIQHRDIKPQNILLVGGGAKVADFGLAKILEHQVTSHTGGLTLSYAAPEFFKGETTNSSDQYSLAISYCQLRGGKLPFTGDVARVTYGHVVEAPNLEMLPEQERAIVARALSKGPQDRWPNCRAFVAALAALDPGGVSEVRAAEKGSCTQVVGPRATNEGPIRDDGTVRPNRAQPPTIPFRPDPTTREDELGASAVSPLRWDAAPKQSGKRTYVWVGAALAACLIAGMATLWGMGWLLPADNRVVPSEPPPRVESVAEKLLKRGDGYLAQAQWSDAIDAYTEAIKHEPTLVAALVGRAQANNNEGRHDLAIIDCNDALALDSKCVEALIVRANARGDKREYDKALADFSEAIRLQRTHVGAHLGRGYIHFAKDQFDEAIADCTEAIRLDASNAQAHWIRAETYLKKREFASAIGDCTQAIKLQSDYVLAYKTRAQAHRESDDNKAALADLSEAIRLDAKDGLLYHDRARLFEVLGDPEKALTDYSLAIQHAPMNALSFNNRGLLWQKKKEFDQAIRDFSAALKIDAKEPLYYRNRADAYEAQGDAVRAQEDRSRAKQLETERPK